MSVKRISVETHEEATELLRMGNLAVKRAQDESRKLGVPNVYTIKGVIYYEQPDGTLSQNDPWKGTQAPKIESS